MTKIKKNRLSQVPLEFLNQYARAVPLKRVAEPKDGIQINRKEVLYCTD